MSEVSIRELRNQGGEVVDRVASGERITITRSGKPVAELRPIQSAPKSIEAIIARRRNLPPINPDRLREDLDYAVDPAL